MQSRQFSLAKYSCGNVVIFNQRKQLYGLLYLPTQMHFPVGREHATCHGSKLTISLGKQLELST